MYIYTYVYLYRDIKVPLLERSVTFGQSFQHNSTPSTKQFQGALQLELLLSNVLDEKLRSVMAQRTSATIERDISIY